MSARVQTFVFDGRKTLARFVAFCAVASRGIFCVHLVAAGEKLHGGELLVLLGFVFVAEVF